MMIQRVIVFILILASVGYLVRSYRRRLRAPKGCAGCPAACGADPAKEGTGCDSSGSPAQG